MTNSQIDKEKKGKKEKKIDKHRKREKKKIIK